MYQRLPISTNAIVSLDAEASSGGSINSKEPKSIRKESNSGAVSAGYKQF
jgi:hypothetical protein